MSQIACGAFVFHLNKCIYHSHLGPENQHTMYKIRPVME